MSLQPNQRFTLVEALDRLIDKGVSVSGDVSISVADVDLVYLGVRLLLASADEVPGLRERAPSRTPPAPAPPDRPRERLPAAARPPLLPAPGATAPPPSGRERESIDIAAGSDRGKAPPPPRLIDMDPDQIEKDLCRLVLTVVELLRQLMEKQAIRRMEGGSLREEEIERLGLAFARMEEKMEELKEVFGLSREDLNIDLGPLGTLV